MAAGTEARPTSRGTPALEWRYCAGEHRGERCPQKLFRLSTGPVLAPGATLEIKCPKCGTLNYLVGPEGLTGRAGAPI